MRSLQLIDHLGSGGAQTIVLDLARHLPSRGIDVEVAHLFSPNVLQDELDDAACVVHDLSTGGRYSPIAALDPRPVARLRRLLRQREYDVINLHLYIAPLHLRLIRGSCRRSVVTNTVHAHEEHLPGYVYPSYRFSRQATDAFIADFAASRDRLCSIAGTTTRVEVIPFGTSPIDAAGVDVRAEQRRAWGVTDDRPVVLSVARLHEQRCIDRILEEFAVVSRSTDAVLVLVGDGPDEGPLKSLSTSLGLDERVCFAGRSSRLSDCFAAADVFVSMSVGGDVGIAALQAASAGLPVLAWDITGAEVAPDDLDAHHPALTGGRDAFAAQLALLCGDDALRAAVATHGCRTARSTFSVENMVDSYAALYADLVARHP